MYNKAKVFCRALAKIIFMMNCDSGEATKKCFRVSSLNLFTMELYFVFVLLH